jgi:leucyl aminopeptidase
MKVTVSSKAGQADLLVIPYTEEDAKKAKGLSIARKAIKKGFFKGEFKEKMILSDGHGKAKRILLVGLGKKKELDREKVRKAYAGAVQAAKALKIESILIEFKGLRGLEDHEVAAAVTEGLLLGNYVFDKYKTKKKGDKEVKEAVILHKGRQQASVKKAVKEASLISGNVNGARDIINENADVMNSLGMVKLAKEIARKNKIRIKVLEEKELKRLGMNLLLAVGKGSNYPTRLIILDYRGGGKDRYALLGKGVTFDAGGMNLKPSGYIETMRTDMSGAAAVLYTIKSLAELKVKKNVVAFLPVCENPIGPGAFKPGDVIKSYSGKTVDIENTDAEGRLILADSLTYAEKNYKPKAIVDIASLTGAALVIFGEFITPLISSEKKYADMFFKAGEKTFDRVWELPLYEDFMEEIKGDIADIKNLGYKRGYAGTIMGAAFLKNFVKKTPLVHLDIGGSCWLDRQRDYLPKGATGAGVRLLVEFFRSL